MADEIIERLYIGDLVDSQMHNEFDRIINALNIIEPDYETEKVDMAALGALCKIIHMALEAGERVLVHCGAGMERSPLVVMWYLYTWKDMSWDEAYALVKSKRQCVYERREWVVW